MKHHLLRCEIVAKQIDDSVADATTLTMTIRPISSPQKGLSPAQRASRPNNASEFGGMSSHFDRESEFHGSVEVSVATTFKCHSGLPILFRSVISKIKAEFWM
jgi:hypothetical protein